MTKRQTVAGIPQSSIHSNALDNNYIIPEKDVKNGLCFILGEIEYELKSKNQNII